MKKILFGILLTLLGFEIPAFASEFQERAMCTALNADAAFPKISIQRDPAQPKRAVLILTASDGWTQVYSGPSRETAATLDFTEDSKVVTATFLKSELKAHISFNGDEYACDERSFGH